MGVGGLSGHASLYKTEQMSHQKTHTLGGSTHPQFRKAARPHILPLPAVHSSDSDREKTPQLGTKGEGISIGVVIAFPKWLPKVLVLSNDQQLRFRDRLSESLAIRVSLPFRCLESLTFHGSNPATGQDICRHPWNGSSHRTKVAWTRHFRRMDAKCGQRRREPHGDHAVYILPEPESGESWLLSPVVGPE